MCISFFMFECVFFNFNRSNLISFVSFSIYNILSHVSCHVIPKLSQIHVNRV